jgi:hypothetical protein
MDNQEEARLRELIRKELENREALKDSGENALRDRRESAEMSDERRRIIDDEIQAFHKRHGRAKEYLNDEGNVEWLSEEEIVNREKQLPVDMEELEVGQQHVRNRVMLLSLLLFVGLVLMFVALRERTGSVQVICNIPRATICLNGSATEYLTDFTLKSLPAGSHLISIAKPGYVPDGVKSATVKITAGAEEIVVLKLKPEPIRKPFE